MKRRSGDGYDQGGGVCKTVDKKGGRTDQFGAAAWDSVEQDQWKAGSGIDRRARRGGRPTSKPA